MKRIICFLAVLFTALAISSHGAYASGTGEVRNLIESLEVGEPVYYQNLTIIPVYNTKIKDWTPYVTLEEAFKNRWIEITELQGGQVPKVRLRNLSNKTIYIMGGEILTGCKQDRIVGRDVLLGPRSKHVVLPVYCVEQGRWQSESTGFYSKKNLGTYALRAEAQCAKEESQSKIWNAVSKVARKMNVRSGTSNYQDVCEDKEIKQKIASYERKMQSIPQLHKDSVGVIVGIGGQIVSVDIFANPELFKRTWTKLLRASALSAISSERSVSITQNRAIAFLRKIHDKRYSEKSAVDLGLEYSVLDNEINANALIYRNAVIHLAAFPQNSRGYTNNATEHRIPVIK